MIQFPMFDAWSATLSRLLMTSRKIIPGVVKQAPALSRAM